MLPHKGIENGRLARAAQLAVRHLGNREYAVQGSHGVRYVNLDVEPACYCEDTEYRGAQCKHALAARLQEHDPSVLNHLVEQIVKREARKREAAHV